MLKRTLESLNVDVSYMILQELQDDKKALHSCLFVRKTWCEMIIPILWKDPWKDLEKGKEKSLLIVLISHIRDGLSQHFNISIKKPLFDYVSYCKHLDLNKLDNIINTRTNDLFGAATNSLLLNTIKDELFKLFINGNTGFTHLHISNPFNYQIHLIPEADHCFSKLKYLECDTKINENIFVGLAGVCKSIQKLKLYVKNDNDGTIKLIDVQKELSNVNLFYERGYTRNFGKILEDSLMKHASTMHYFKINKQPFTGILSYFVNLKGLELDNTSRMNWGYLENLSLPSLQILKVSRVPINVLPNIIQSTNESLVEVCSNYLRHDNAESKGVVQVIYQKCPNLKYLQLMLTNSNVLDLEQLLINRQYLTGLYILINNKEEFDWDSLFGVLIRSSPTGLFMFKFYFHKKPKLESLKSFFDGWKDRLPLSLQFLQKDNVEEYSDLVKTYKEKGIVKKFDSNLSYDEFEWI